MPSSAVAADGVGDAERGVVEDAAAVVPRALEPHGREIRAAAQLILEVGAFQPAPCQREPLRVGVREDQGSIGADEVEIGSVVGFLEVAVDTLDLVAGRERVVHPESVLVPVVQVGLIEAVAGRVQHTGGCRVPGVVVVDVRGAGDVRRKSARSFGIELQAGQLHHVHRTDDAIGGGVSEQPSSRSAFAGTVRFCAVCVV